jgi:hypothetical protein
VPGDKKAEKLFGNRFPEFKASQSWQALPLLNNQWAVLGVQRDGKAKSHPGPDFADEDRRIRKTDRLKISFGNRRVPLDWQRGN